MTHNHQGKGSLGKTAEHLEFLCPVGRNLNEHSHLGNGQYLQKLSKGLPPDVPIPQQVSNRRSTSYPKSTCQGAQGSHILA